MSVVCIPRQDLVAVCLQIVCYHVHLKVHVPKEAGHIVGFCVAMLHNDDGYPLSNLDPTGVPHELNEVLVKGKKPPLFLVCHWRRE